MINFFFPPLGGGGVIRASKFAQYLPDFYWQPLILTVKNWKYHAVHNSEIHTFSYPVYRTAALNWQIGYELLYKFRLDFIAHFLQQKETNWLIPDRMIFWLLPAYFLAKKIHSKSQNFILCYLRSLLYFALAVYIS